MLKKKKLFKVKIKCGNCHTFLYDYTKEGPGSLIKCFVSNIKNDQTSGSCRCPNCDLEFARPTKIGNRTIWKIIGGRVEVKGNTGKK